MASSSTIEAAFGTTSTAPGDRRTAAIVGWLFIVALVLHLVGGAIYGPATGSEDFLDRAHPDRTTVTLGVLVEFIAVMSIPLIAIFMFPVLRRFSEALALAYVGFRALEAVFLITMESRILALTSLSEDAQNVDATSGTLQALGDALLAQNESTFELYVLVFTTGALIFYAMLYRTRLVPNWLAIWGFAAAAWMLAGTTLMMLGAFGDASEAVIQTIFVIPVPLNELALAAWLIHRGFDGRSSIASEEPEPEPGLAAT